MANDAKLSDGEMELFTDVKQRAVRLGKGEMLMKAQVTDGGNIAYVDILNEVPRISQKKR